MISLPSGGLASVHWTSLSLDECFLLSLHEEVEDNDDDEDEGKPLSLLIRLDDVEEQDEDEEAVRLTHQRAKRIE